MHHIRHGRFGLHRFSAILHQWMHRFRVLFRVKSTVTSSNLLF
jgi:hypothetical protein